MSPNYKMYLDALRARSTQAVLVYFVFCLMLQWIMNQHPKAVLFGSIMLVVATSGIGAFLFNSKPKSIIQFEENRCG